MPIITKSASAKVAQKRKYTRTTSSISVKRDNNNSQFGESLLQKLESQLKINTSYVNIALGLLVVLVVGVLVFNYFKGNQSDLGPAQNTVSDVKPDVKPDSLPGSYLVKEGDTLFSIAQTYYQDGFKFDRIAADNKMANADVLEVGQKLNIPKLEEAVVATDQGSTGTGGAVNQTMWGEKITVNTYTVVEGDWLSKIAGRAYGDVMAFDKIAKANNISNPDLIEPGTVLTIPR